jgi:GxxExxY protein
MDLLVSDTLVIEIKSIEELAAVHHKQLLTYLKLAKKRVGVLVNFNTDNISKSIIRKVNGY